MRYFFEVTYDGANYNGWQNQANALGVQQVLEDTLSKLLRQKISIVGSGRTDTGVHCVQQFFHADIPSEIKQQDFLQRINSFLPKDVAIRDVFPVKPDAHARYDAHQRSYEYHITIRKNPLLVGHAFYFFKQCDISLMNEAAEGLVGEHDFTSFSKVKTDVNHFVCTIKVAHWKKTDDLLIFNISANRFLRGMVRAIVGTLLDVGTQKISIKEFQSIIKSKDRKKAGMNVPPEGLYLTEVKYPKNVFLKSDD
ncbi:MAG TPA: tRNA pseudouridine(38-40) synthase TruA [Cyclobacteriaceae bacterium]|jgi:tRNA pseudouridine38-40 synthase|nr:tRNA pseudouridine(38-40) synthase TruA [Cyclobacteriaceae bacterium]